MYALSASRSTHDDLGAQLTSVHTIKVMPTYKLHHVFQDRAQLGCAVQLNSLIPSKLVRFTAGFRDRMNKTLGPAKGFKSQLLREPAPGSEEGLPGGYCIGMWIDRRL